jgi:hypothetical protein
MWCIIALIGNIRVIKNLCPKRNLRNGRESSESVAGERVSHEHAMGHLADVFVIFRPDEPTRPWR